MRAVIAAEAEAVKNVQVTDDFVRAVEALRAARGKVITTGIGKAGHIAEKFAATLCSTATPAIFLHAAEAAHGDLGIVQSEDVMIAFSTSGKSVEVLEVLELSRHLGIAPNHRRHVASRFQTERSFRPGARHGRDRRSLSDWSHAEQFDGRHARDQRRHRARAARSQRRDQGPTSANVTTADTWGARRALTTCRTIPSEGRRRRARTTVAASL